MPRKDTPPAAEQARALVDLPAYGVACGGLLSAPGDEIAALAAAGHADPHPDAVAAAKAQQEPTP